MYDNEYLGTVEVLCDCGKKIVYDGTSVDYSDDDWRICDSCGRKFKIGASVKVFIIKEGEDKDG